MSYYTFHSFSRGKKIFLLQILLLCIFSYNSFCQSLTFSWANKLSATTGYDQAGEIELYNNTHIYAIGRLSGTMDFDPSGSTYNLSSTGFDHYLAKYTTANVLSWAIDWSLTNVDLTVDNSGNAYVVSSFDGTVDFDPGAATYNLNSGSGSDMAIIKVNTSGLFQWAINAGNTTSGSMYPQAIALDAAGNIYVCGYFYSTQDFDPSATTVNKTSAGSEDIYIAKYSNTGGLLWVNTVGSTSSDQALDLAVDGSGQVYVCGTFYGTVDFDPSASVSSLSSASGYTCGFFAKYNTDGTFAYAKQLLGTNVTSIKNIILTYPDQLVLSGKFANTTDFDPSSGTNNLSPPTTTTNDLFFAKYSVSGDLLWVKAIGASSTWGEELNSIKTDIAGNIYAVGTYTYSIDMDPSASSTLLSSTLGDGNYSFLARYNYDGNLNWAYQISSNNTVWGLAVDNSYNIYTTGFYGSNIDVDVSPSTYSLTVSGFSFDSYIAKYSQTGTILPVELISFSGEFVSNAVELQWEVAEEVNLSHYEVLRSEDGLNFYSIGIAVASGEKMYSLRDATIGNISGQWFYKLKMVDADDSFMYSDVISIKNSLQGISVFYDFETQNFVFQNLPEQYFFELYDIQGRLIISNSAIENSMHFGIRELQKGVYLVVIRTETESFIKKLSIQ
ncbi:MAG: T9SS type A sorting domain-containing protein [Chitinophagales bacterium]